jgi:hypothetical protein
VGGNNHQFLQKLHYPANIPQHTHYWPGYGCIVIPLAGGTTVGDKFQSNIFSLLGIVLSILLVFRTNTAYDRWWEGRKLWEAGKQQP